jgi:benzylsuccinate CoA-transferase BbsE subunit
MPERALEGIRVVDMSGPMGNYCGKLFADLGADVVLVEPPGGTELRRRDPIAFAYHNANKRSVEHEDGLVEALLAAADLVIETDRPGTWSYAELAERNPALVLVSITPFGQTGPYAGYAGSDLVCLALGGLLSLTGYADGPPVRIAGDQSYVMGSLYGAVAGLMAVLHAEATGEGQHVDVSLQECVATALENAPQFYDLEGVVRGRPSGMQRHAGTGLYPCADGYVYLYVGGLASGRFWTRLVDWLVSEGVPRAQELTAPEWNDRPFLETDAAKQTFGEIFGAFASERGKAELYEQAQGRGIPLSPVATTADVAANPQLRDRGFFAQTPWGETVGAPYKLSATPWSLDAPAPALGEHTEALRREVSPDGLASLEAVAQGAKLPGVSR